MYSLPNWSSNTLACSVGLVPNAKKPTAEAAEILPPLQPLAPHHHKR
jgi:hypothetical protein